MEKTMDKIVALAKSRGFIYPGSEIYGGLANTWDYGNLGVELKNNVKKAWWQKFIQENKYNVGVDCAILMNPQTWVASGHLGGFSDPLMDCKECHERFRADQLIEEFAGDNDIELDGSVDGWSNEQMEQQMYVVYDTLRQMGAEGKPVITLFNKQDRLEKEESHKDFQADYSIATSAKTGQGLDKLKAALLEIIRRDQIYVERLYPFADAGKIQMIRSKGQLLSEEYLPEGIQIKAYVPQDVYGKL